MAQFPPSPSNIVNVNSGCALLRIMIMFGLKHRNPDLQVWVGLIVYWQQDWERGDFQGQDVHHYHHRQHYTLPCLLFCLPPPPQKKRLQVKFIGGNEGTCSKTNELNVPTAQHIWYSGARCSWWPCSAGPTSGRPWRTPCHTRYNCIDII